MQAVSNPNRSPVFRLITIASSGLGSFIIGLWGLKFGFGDSIAGMPTDVIGSIIAALCALAAGGAALSFFAGVDESADYVFNETHFDKLTGLLCAHRHGRQDRGSGAGDHQVGEPVFLIDIDIDRFKHINDSIGYSQGDELIRAFAQRLRASLPEGVVIGRIGAGEFAVLYPDSMAEMPMDEIVEKLIDDLMEPYQLPTHLQSVNLSVGIVAMPKDGTDPVVMLRRSNLALQHARAGGIGNWSVFHPDMGQVADYRQWIESELHTAFVRGDFDLHYQPQLDLAEGQGRRLRGADPLAPSRARHDLADGVHPDRRGDRHDPADRRVGAEASLQRRQAPARGLLRRRQHLAGPVHHQGLRRHRHDVMKSPASSRSGSSWKSPRPR